MTTSTQLQTTSVRSPAQLSAMTEAALPTCWMTIAMPDGTNPRVPCTAVAHVYTPYPGTLANGWVVEISGSNQQWPLIKMTTDAMFSPPEAISVPHSAPGRGPHGSGGGYQAHASVTYGSNALACGSQYVNVTAIGSQKSSGNGETDYAITGNGGVLCAVGSGSAQINVAF